jgi:uncharacterized protein
VLIANIAQLLKSPIGTTRELEVADNININNEKSLFESQVKLVRTNRSILATGKFNSHLKLECCRCLKTFNCPISFNIEEEYFPVTDTHTGIHLASPEEPDSFTIDEHHMINLTEAIRQNAVLAIPMKLLCHPDCSGV